MFDPVRLRPPRLLVALSSRLITINIKYMNACVLISFLFLLIVDFPFRNVIFYIFFKLRHHV